MSNGISGRLVLALCVGLGLVMLSCFGSGSASAKSTVFGFSNTPSTTQAGGHPNVITVVEVGNRFNQGPTPPCECNDPKDIAIHTPAGVIANPHVVSECTTAELATFSCPPESQAGFVVVRFFNWGVIPLYRTVPQAGQAALFVFLPPLTVAIPQYLAVSARTGGDYGLDFKIQGITHTLPPTFIGNVFWGVPGDPANDAIRFAPGERSIECSSNPLAALANDIVPGDCGKKEPHSSSLPIEPFVQAPTTCVGPLSSSVETLAYDNETDTAEAPWPATTGCDKLSFSPSLSAAPTTTEADSASGLAVDLKVPQFEDPSTPSPSEIRATTVTLPPGFSINPNAADGKSVCSDEQANLTNEEAAQCPEFSKIGTTELDSSALPGPIPGYIYLGEPKPGDRYRVILTASGFGTNIKLLGSIRPDPQTGQLVTAFENLPQAPFQEFNLHFFGSERGVLATPTQCGTYPVKTSFEPWAAPELSDQTSTQFFTIDSGPGGKPCPAGPRPFGPSLQAGVADNTAGLHSPLTLALGREDGEQNLTGLTIKTPPGFSATLKGIPYCPQAAIAQLAVLGYSGLVEQSSPSCPAASQVGTAVAGAGAGTHPLYVNGKAYLAGPYKGAPLSLEVVIPAVSGPYDLGNVAVRAALDVDPTTAQVTTVSDPLPQILEGVPLRTRSIQVNLDRPGFALNPTNCDPFAIAATLSGSEGGLSDPSAHFQVANCADLPFAPKLALSLKGATRRASHPALKAVLTQGLAGEANAASTSVALPHSLILDNAHIRSPCTRAALAADNCPPGSVIGSAKAETPLLSAPLEGPVYLATGFGHKLPDLIVDLKGQIDVVLDGRIDTTAKEQIRTTFQTIPDAPVSKFTLSLDGGNKGLLFSSENLCKKRQVAVAKIGAQNGKSANQRPLLALPCGSKVRHKRHRGSHLSPKRVGGAR
jgi:hypothetical protein